MKKNGKKIILAIVFAAGSFGAYQYLTGGCSSEESATVAVDSTLVDTAVVVLATDTAKADTTKK